MIRLGIDFFVDDAPGFCAHNWVHSYSSDQYDKTKKEEFEENEHYDGKVTAKNDKQAAVKIVKMIFNYPSALGPVFMFCDIVGGIMYEDIIRHFKDGDRIKGPNGWYRIAISKPYRNTNTNNEVIEMRVQRTSKRN